MNITQIIFVPSSQRCPCAQSHTYIHTQLHICTCMHTHITPSYIYIHTHLSLSVLHLQICKDARTLYWKIKQKVAQIKLDTIF